MKLKEKMHKINRLENYNSFIENYIKITNSNFYEIKFAVFELKESIYRLNEYLYYSDKNPFSDNIPFVKYSRFVYESYLNDTYIIQTRFRKLINVIKKEKRFLITEEEINIIENKFSVVVGKLIKITKEKRGEHVHNKRYNDIDFMICDAMERVNNLSKKLTEKPFKEYNGSDLYKNIAIDHLDDVQNLIIETNNYIYNSIDLFLKEITETIVNKINLYTNDVKI